ncbi:tRNA-intron endonuclease [Fasciola gigantica]|uniref:tRNA-intron lyase n=1 Tax=Fasciola gigantica TaxID=46835 RepID=A0A504YLC3_FASGI|nr:tRNA-intron endonuclease [Fasciola gigantica]
MHNVIFFFLKATEDPYETFLGRPKLTSGVSTWTAPPTGPLFPIHLKEDDNRLDCSTSGSTKCHFEAQLVSSSRARVTDPCHISVLRSRGCYGYLPSEERQLIGKADSEQITVDTDEEEEENEFHGRYQSATLEDAVEPQKNDEASELYLTDEEIMFLLHTLGCLKVTIPPGPDGDTPVVISNPHRLWFNLCSGELATQPIEPHLARTTDSRFRLAEQDLLRRYAAYVYYRARGWVVRPGLALGGVHFLLYAQGPAHRHATFAVLVDPATDPDPEATKQVTCSEMAAHVRVVHSVGKRLILCRVRLPSLDTYRDTPWDAIREATVSGMNGSSSVSLATAIVDSDIQNLERHFRIVTVHDTVTTRCARRSQHRSGRNPTRAQWLKTVTNQSGRITQSEMQREKLRDITWA